VPSGARRRRSGLGHARERGADGAFADCGSLWSSASEATRLQSVDTTALPRVRVLIPYVTLYPGVREAVEDDGWTPELVAVGHSPTAYHEAFAVWWADGEAFCVVEQDIVIFPGALDELRDCPEPWCGRPYSLSTGYGAYLGCTRFSASLLRSRPSLMGDIDGLRFDGTPRRMWGRLDTRLKQVLEDSGISMHVHWPAVGHLNPAQQPPIVNCPRCGLAIPDETVRLGPSPQCQRCSA
jgi:hypothetical protein